MTNTELPISAQSKINTKSTKDDRTMRSTGADPSLPPMASDSERLLQSAASLSFCTLLKNPEIENQEQSTVGTAEHALAINYEGFSQNSVPDDAAAHTHFF